MNVPIRTADIPADAPRWTDPAGAVWAEVADDHLVIVEHNGQPVPVADAIPRRVVVRQNGQLTAVAVPVVDHVEIAVQAGMAAMDWSEYPDPPNGGEPAAEAAAGAVRAALNALAPVAVVLVEIADDVVQDVADAIGETFRSGHPFSADWTAEARAAIEAYRQHVVAARDEEVERLRAQVAAWQAHASEMEKQLNHIEHLASRGLDKNGFEKPSDVLTEIYDSAEAPARPAALDETAAAQETQEMPSTAECVLSEYEGPEACFERDCEEYVDDEGNDRPEVERCSHIREVAPTTDEESASPTA